MALNDDLLQADACAWGAGMSDGSWLIPPRVKVWFANTFGEPFLLMEDGSVDHTGRNDRDERRAFESKLRLSR